MNIKVPGKAELRHCLAKVAKRYIHNDCQRNQAGKQQISIHRNIVCFRSDKVNPLLLTGTQHGK